MNAGKSHDDLSSLAEARRYYDLAFDKIDDVPSGPYRDMVAGGIAEGKKRAASRPLWLVDPVFS